MTDSFTNEPISVSTSGNSGPYIAVQLDQLALVRRILDEAGQRYYVEEYAISLDERPVTAVIDLEVDADIEGIQRCLDRTEDPRMSREGSRRNGHHG